MDEYEITVECKRLEIDALKKAKATSDDSGSMYWGGKAQAYSQIWELLVFKGKKVGCGITPQEYNRQNDLWSKYVDEGA